MDAIQAARQLGHAIQADERYIAYTLASQRCDEDKELGENIVNFNQKRGELSLELQKSSDKDEELVKRLNTEMREMYASIMKNENMARKNVAMAELNELSSFISQIISGASQGQNPDTIEYSADCGGDCSGCSGCH